MEESAKSCKSKEKSAADREVEAAVNSRNGRHAQREVIRAKNGGKRAQRYASDVHPGLVKRAERSLLTSRKEAMNVSYGKSSRSTI